MPADAACVKMVSKSWDNRKGQNTDDKLDRHIYEGRPADTSGRLEKEIRTYDLLDELGIRYQRVDHEAAMTVDDCRGVDELLGIDICKNLFLTNSQKTKFYLLLMPGKETFCYPGVLRADSFTPAFFRESGTVGADSGSDAGIGKYPGADE